MLIMPELAVALRRELTETLVQKETDVIALSTWEKSRSGRAAATVATLRCALEQALPVVLWQRGEWAAATAARDVIGGELTTGADMEPLGQLWLFDSVSLPAAVKKRFGLPVDTRTVGRVLLPVEPTSGEQEGGLQRGTAMGYLFRTAPERLGQPGTPFLRLLPDLYPGEFVADPHINFVAAYRYAQRCRRPVPAPGKGRVFLVGPTA